MKIQTRFLIRGIGIGIIITAALFYFFLSFSEPMVLPDQMNRTVDKTINI